MTIEEKWAYFLKKIEDNLLENADNEYNQLIKNIESKIDTTESQINFINNPFSQLKIANYLIYNDSIFHNKYNDAQ